MRSVLTRGFSSMTSYLKTPPFHSASFRRLVTTLPCMECGAEGTQAAHRNFGKGMGMKTSDALVVALCPTCHSAMDQGKEMTREERREMWNRNYIKQMAFLVEKGILK